MGPTQKACPINTVGLVEQNYKNKQFGYLLIEIHNLISGLLGENGHWIELYEQSAAGDMFTQNIVQTEILHRQTAYTNETASTDLITLRRSISMASETGQNGTSSLTVGGQQRQTEFCKPM